MTKPFVYVDSDVPEGMTLTEFRRSATPRRPRRHHRLGGAWRVLRTRRCRRPAGPGA